MPSKTVKSLTKELKILVKDWNETDLVPQSEKGRAREIGESLYAVGGISVMHDVYYEVKATNRCAYALQAYWDKIGEWRY